MTQFVTTSDEIEKEAAATVFVLMSTGAEITH